MSNLKSYTNPLWVVVCAIIFFSACSKNSDPQQPTLNFEVNKSTITFPANAYTDTLKIESNVSWKIISSPSWIALSQTEGIGNGNIYLIVAENTTAEENTGSIDIEWDKSNTSKISVKQARYGLVINESIYRSVGQGSIVINGTGFSGVASENSVTIAGLPMNVAYASPTMLTVDIPLGQPSGDLVLTVGGRTAQAMFRYVWQGMVTVIAGGNGPGYLDGPAVTAQFHRPTSLILEPNGDLLVCDGNNNKIRRISTSGIVSTLPGRLPESADPGAAVTNFDLPNDITRDVDGNIYVSEFSSNVISKITPGGVVSIFAGNTQYASVDGPALSASFQGLHGVYADPGGDIYVTEAHSNRIRKISVGEVTTVAGNTVGYNDGTGTAALFSGPVKIARHSSGDLLIVDVNNHRIRRMTLAGIVTTYAGSGAIAQEDGDALSAGFDHPGAIVTDNLGNAYVGDASNYIRMITVDGQVSTIATLPNTFIGPYGLAINANNEIFVADSWNHRICKVTLQ